MVVNIPTMFSVAKSDNQSESDLEKALRVSEQEARLADMTEEELLNTAIQRSLEDQDGQVDESKRLSKRRKVDEEENMSSMRGKKILSQSQHPEVENSGKLHASTSKVSLHPPPVFREDSFDTRLEKVIDRFHGSLDLVMCKSWLKEGPRRQLREWMLSEIAWHRVSYIRPSNKQRIVTPRFTATFGKDDTGAPADSYLTCPKPIPGPLQCIVDELERKVGKHFNAVIINYYADGQDSISYHSDDESFLGSNPTIASLSLGAARDFYLRRKAPLDEDVPAPTHQQKMGTKGRGPAASRPTEKMVLEDGDLLIMKGKTQAEWEHSIPKRAKHLAGRINITFRRVVNVKGTNNFLRYNRLGDGESAQYRWHSGCRQMIPGQNGI